MLRSIALFAAVLAASPVLGQTALCTAPADALSASDEERLAALPLTRTQGLAAALLGASAADRQTVGELFASAFTPLGTIPDGAYDCRTIKLGGMLSTIIYKDFACTIGENGTRIEKTTGSQRFSGSLNPSGGSLFYRGALHYGDETPKRYGDDPERNQVGCLSLIAGDTPTYLLELPAPRFESIHDVIELRPR